MRKVVTMLAILSLACITQAQNTNRTAYYDSLTYADYLKADWKELHQHGKTAIKENAASDWVYKRMGYGLNVRRKYLSSTYYYNKVLHENREDADALVMNFNNYVNSGMQGAAGVIDKWMTDGLRDYVGVRRKILESIYLEGGAVVSNNLKQNGNTRLFDPQHLLGTQDLTTGMYYWQLGLTLNAGKTVSFNIAYTGMILPHSDQYQYGYPKLVGTQPSQNNGVPYMRNIYQPADSTATIKYNTQQHQAYIGANFSMPYGWGLTPFIHLLIYNTTLTSFNTQPQYYLAQPIDTFQSVRPSVTYTNSPLTSVDAVLGFNLYKQYRNVLFEAGGSYSSISKVNTWQANASVTYYPLGNTYLSFTPRLTYQNLAGSNKLLYQLNVSGRLHKYLWLSTYGTYGDLLYSNEANGSTVFNSTNSTQYRLGATLYSPVHKNVGVFLGYQFRQMKGTIYKYTNNTNYDTYQTSYQNHLLTLGLKFNL